MNERFYPAVVVELSEEDGGGFAAYAPDLPGCMGDGNSPVEALSDLQDAVREWIDEAFRLEREVPAPGAALHSKNDQYRELIELVEKQDRALQSQSDIIGEQGDLLERQGRLIHELHSMTRQILDAAQAQARGRFDPWLEPRQSANRSFALAAVVTNHH